MTGAGGNHWRERLISMRDALDGIAASAREGSQTVDLDQSRVGRLSRMDALQMQAMSQASDARRALLRKRINGALERLDQGTYGRCVQCQESIAEGRLRADPTVLTCIDCASRAEAD